MYKHLYDCFKQWYNKGSIYLYSDTHFGDEELREAYPRRPTDEEQVKILNNYITKQDTLVLLGDVGNVEPLCKLRGYKVLILGNHDKGASVYAPYFDEIYEGPLIISPKIILSHEPLNEDFLFNIHGHNHADTIMDARLNHLNVCGEATGYRPISLSLLISSGKLKNIDIHKKAIEEAKARKSNLY